MESENPATGDNKESNMNNSTEGETEAVQISTTAEESKDNTVELHEINLGNKGSIGAIPVEEPLIISDDAIRPSKDSENVGKEEIKRVSLPRKESLREGSKTVTYSEQAIEIFETEPSSTVTEKPPQEIVPVLRTPITDFADREFSVQSVKSDPESELQTTTSDNKVLKYNSMRNRIESLQRSRQWSGKGCILLTEDSCQIIYDASTLEQISGKMGKGCILLKDGKMEIVYDCSDIKAEDFGELKPNELEKEYLDFLEGMEKKDEDDEKKYEDEEEEEEDDKMEMNPFKTYVKSPSLELLEERARLGVTKRQLPYMTLNEVVLHNKINDCWVIHFGVIRNLTGLIREYINKRQLRLVKPIIAHAGKDISHWFNEHKNDIQHFVHPITGVCVPYCPHGPVPDVGLQVPSTKWKGLQKLPWWQDTSNIVGLITKETRPVRILNTLFGKEVLIYVCCEDTINRILERYLPFNKHARSYTWKYKNKILDMNLTLAENGITDERKIFNNIGLRDDTYIPCLLIYFNDDLTEM